MSKYYILIFLEIDLFQTKCWISVKESLTAGGNPVMCLDFLHISNRFLSHFYNFFSHLWRIFTSQRIKQLLSAKIGDLDRMKGNANNFVENIIHYLLNWNLKLEQLTIIIIIDWVVAGRLACRDLGEIGGGEWRHGGRRRRKRGLGEKGGEGERNGGKKWRWGEKEWEGKVFKLRKKGEAWG